MGFQLYDHSEGYQAPKQYYFRGADQILERYDHINTLRPSDAYMIYVSVSYPSLVQIMACRLAGAKPLSEPMLEYC